MTTLNGTAMNTTNRRQFMALAACASGAWELSGQAMAQTAPQSMPVTTPAALRWPVDTIKFMAPVPAGGGVDIFCRRLAERMKVHLATNVIVDNKPGGGALLGARSLASSPANGSAVGYLHSGHVSLQAMGAKLDMVTEFKPVLPRMQASAFVLAVNADSPFKTLAELLKFMADQPNKLNYGTGGPGSPAHIVFETLKSVRPEISAVQIPFKGAIEGVNALVGKNIDFVIGVASTMIPHVKAGSLRGLAVSTSARVKLLPDVPTMSEAGVTGFQHASWSGVFAPAGTPDALIEQMRAALIKIQQESDFIAFVESTGAVMLPPDTPQVFDAYLKSAIANETKLMSRLGIKV